MPIKHLEERTRYLRLGKIRLGIQVPKLDDKGQPVKKYGKEVMRPKATDYFVVKTDWLGLAQEVADIYGEKPTDFDIEFLFDEEEETFPRYLKHYRGDRQLKCMGNGSVVLSRRHFFREEKIDVRPIMEGVFNPDRLKVYLPKDNPDEYIERMLGEWQSEYGWGAEWAGEAEIPCLGPQCLAFGSDGCRSTARLLFGIRGIKRFGFWEMVVHEHALVGIKSQLDLTRAFTSNLMGQPTILNVPFKMRLVGPTKMKIPRKQKDGTMEERLVDVWTPEIQPDPDWVAQIYDQRAAWLAGVGERKALAAGVEIPPEEEEALDYVPGDGEDEEDEPIGNVSSDAMSQFWAYAKKKKIEGSAKEILKEVGDDPEKGLIRLKELTGEI